MAHSTKTMLVCKSLFCPLINGVSFRTVRYYFMHTALAWWLDSTLSLWRKACAKLKCENKIVQLLSVLIIQ